MSRTIRSFDVEDEGGSRRSSRPEVRNPLVVLPGVQGLLDLPADARGALRTALLDIRRDAKDRAQSCWRKHKAPMAVYWKVLAVYAGHLSRMLRDRPQCDSLALLVASQHHQQQLMPKGGWRSARVSRAKDGRLPGG
jgi:hypothetical protein